MVVMGVVSWGDITANKQAWNTLVSTHKHILLPVFCGVPPCDQAAVVNAGGCRASAVGWCPLASGDRARRPPPAGMSPTWATVTKSLISSR